MEDIRQKHIIKNCDKHGDSTFHLRNKGKYNYYVCGKCEYDRVKTRRQKLKQDSVVYCGGKCELCGYSKCIQALEFHHRNPEEKDFTISAGKTLSWDKIKAELDKCTMFCANCHRETHTDVAQPDRATH